MIETLDDVDALIFVHPDFDTPQSLRKVNPVYLQFLEAATRYMQEHDKPVFALPAYHERTNPSPELWDQWKIMPTPHGWHYSQEDVDFIAQGISKPIEEIVIAVGGIAASICVANALDAWCKEHETPLWAAYEPRPFLEQRFAYGILIPELTDGWLNS